MSRSYDARSSSLPIALVLVGLLAPQLGASWPPLQQVETWSELDENYNVTVWFRVYDPTTDSWHEGSTDAHYDSLGGELWYWRIFDLNASDGVVSWKAGAFWDMGVYTHWKPWDVGYAVYDPEQAAWQIDYTRYESILDGEDDAHTAERRWRSGMQRR